MATASKLLKYGIHNPYLGQEPKQEHTIASYVFCVNDETMEVKRVNAPFTEDSLKYIPMETGPAQGKIHVNAWVPGLAGREVNSNIDDCLVYTGSFFDPSTSDQRDKLALAVRYIRVVSLGSGILPDPETGLTRALAAVK
jgi:hypothetical protein